MVDNVGFDLIIEKKSNILICDDREDVIALYKELVSLILKKEKFLIIEANDGITAQSKITNQEFDLILIRKNLPNKDGLLLLKKLSTDIKIDKKTIILSLDKDDLNEEIKEEIIKTGIRKCITNPLENKELVFKSLHKILKNSK